MKPILIISKGFPANRVSEVKGMIDPTTAESYVAGTKPKAPVGDLEL
jgi:hypothetical protein